MKKLLVTGGSGFLGSRIVRAFRDRWEVYAPSHQQMDITCPEDVDRVLAAFRPDAVIHCAAMADTGRCQREPELSWILNVTGSVNVARSAGALKARCVLCSSDQVYYPVPANVYAHQKLAAERECLRINPDCIFLRLSWMYDPNLTDTARRRDFFTTLLPLLDTREEVAYASFDKRGITDVYQVIGNLEKALDLPGGIYDFGSPNDKSMYHTAASLFAGLGLDPCRVRENTEAFRDKPRDLTMDQTVVNRHGIYFPDTTQALAEHFAKHLALPGRREGHPGP